MVLKSFTKSYEFEDFGGEFVILNTNKFSDSLNFVQNREEIPFDQMLRYNTNRCNYSCDCKGQSIGN